MGIGMIPVFIGIVANPTRVFKHEAFLAFIEYLGIDSARELLIYGAISLVGIFLVKNLFYLFYKYFESRFVFNRRYLFSHRLMQAYMQAPYTFHLQRNTAELLRNVTGEVNLLINNVLHPTLRILKELVMVISVVAFLFFIEPLITLFVFIFMGGTAGIFLFFTQRKMKLFGSQEQEYRKLMMKTASEGFGGIKEARVLNRETYLVEIFRKMSFKSSRLQMFRSFVAQIPRPAIEALAIIGIMLISLIMVMQDRPLANIVPVLALFGASTIRLMPSIQLITQMMTELRYHIVSVNPIYDDLNVLNETSLEFKSEREKNEKLEFKQSIVFNNVNYQYPDSNEQALDGINIDIPYGHTIAFIGPSGAGKTTIVDLLLGLIKPLQGDILVDGKSIFNNVSAWQRNIGYIPQFIYLTDNTLRCNIAFGLPDHMIDDLKIDQAVNSAQLKDLVEHLLQGVETVVGENGIRLSGGQRQRVGIARALYNNPQVLVMDEATSSLDGITEQQVIDSIENLKEGRTVIMIAHRLTTVMKCDKLFMIEDGKVIDAGTYDELLKSNKKFREMARKYAKL